MSVRSEVRLWARAARDRRRCWRCACSCTSPRSSTRCRAASRPRRSSRARAATGPGSRFYSVFVLAVSVHAPIGLRNVLAEWLRWRGRSRDAVLVLFAAALACIGHERRLRGLRMKKELSYWTAIVHRVSGVALAALSAAALLGAVALRSSSMRSSPGRAAAGQARRMGHRGGARRAPRRRPARARARVPALAATGRRRLPPPRPASPPP